MPQIDFLSPGVYGFEVAPTRAPDQLSPAKAGFIGWTERGPVNTPIEVRSVNEFTTYFGNINSDGLVAICMRPYFGTGGQRAWVVRVVPADAVEASATIDFPIKWTFTANGAGTWGNDLIIRIDGNRNFLDRTPGAQGWTKFDLKVLQPALFDPTLLTAAETFEAIQFSDPFSADYVVSAMTDPRNPSLLVDILTNAGGTPAAFTAMQIEDEVIGTGDLLATKRFIGNLAQTPVLDGTLRIVASSATISDEAQTVSPLPDNSQTAFACTLATAPILDASLRLFYAKITQALNENPGFATPDGIVVDFSVPALALSDSVHRETTVFRIKVPNLDAASSVPGNLGTTAAITGFFDLSAAPLPVTTPGQPIHPGTVIVTFQPSGAITDALGDGTVSGAGFAVGGPFSGYIDYATGQMWQDAGFTVPLTVDLATNGVTPSTNVTADFDVSTFLIKQSSGDNMEVGATLDNALTFPAGIDTGGVNPNTIDLVDSVTTPTGSGAIAFSLLAAPDTWGPGAILVDFVPSGIIDTNLDGDLTGTDVDPGASVDFTTGVFTGMVLAVAPRSGTTIDANYQVGQVATDNGLGFLVGDVDATGNNTIDYDTGAFDVTFDTAPVNGTNILANYTKLAKSVQYTFSGGLNGTAVTRAEISDPSLETAREGIYAFDNVEEPLNLVVPDFEGSAYVQADIVDYCEARNTRFAILGFANGTTKDEAIKYVLVDQAYDTKVAATYWPNVYFVNEVTDRVELLPVTPFIAGVYAKTAFNKNVGKSPGGIDDGALDANGTIGPEFGDLVNDIRIRDDLYQSRINPLFNSDATGFVVWGVRSLSTEFRWRYVNARLLHNFLMDSIKRQLQWAVFENNGPALWSKIKIGITGYMESLFVQGYFAGTTSAQAYFVTCDQTNNNQGTVDEGKVILDIGFSPSKPAEFVIFRLSQPASTITV